MKVFLLIATLFAATPLFAQAPAEKKALCSLQPQLHLAAPQLYMPTNRGYLSTAKLLQNILQLPSEPILILDLDELRMIPFTSTDSHIVAWIDRTEPLNPSRLQRVLASAQQRKISVHIIWHGDSLSSEHTNQAWTLLSELTQKTGGHLLEASALMHIVEDVCAS